MTCSHFLGFIMYASAWAAFWMQLHSLRAGIGIGIGIAYLYGVVWVLRISILAGKTLCTRHWLYVDTPMMTDEVSS